MRVPKNIKKKNNDIVEKDQLIEINDITNPFRKIDISDDKLKIKWIKTVEKAVRSSIEYKNYLKYLKETIDISHCTFFTKLDINDIKGVGLEFHHYPFTLFDIVSIVLEEKINMNEDIDFFEIANEVMELHFTNKVGLVPLSLTLHEMAHTGYLFIPLKAVYGNYQKFINDYRESISSDLMDRIIELGKLSDEMGYDYLPDNLDTKTLFIDSKDVFPELTNFIDTENDSIQIETENNVKQLEHRKPKIEDTKKLTEDLFNEED